MQSSAEGTHNIDTASQKRSGLATDICHGLKVFLKYGDDNYFSVSAFIFLIRQFFQVFQQVTLNL